LHPPEGVEKYFAHEKLFQANSGFVYVNGQAVEYNSIFYRLAMPFLPEDAVEAIEEYLNNIEP
jgi:hypothetical protein